jgi:hypothetical protein
MFKKQISKTVSRRGRPRAFLPQSTLVALIAGLAASACGGEQGIDEPSSGAEVGSGVDSLERDLSTGAEGDDVRALHGFLARYGYFPNEELAAAYPNWVPLLSEGPARPDVFDDQSLKAVSLLQAYYGLERTGFVDQATRDALRLPRCRHPEGLAPDGSQKFSIIPAVELGARWGSSVTYQVVNGDPNGFAPITLSQARATMAVAVNQWRARTTLTITELTSGTADIMVNFGPLDGIGGAAGMAYRPGQDITLDSAEDWTLSTPPPEGKVHLLSLMMHEFGHTLGIGHSSIAGAVMQPLVPAVTQLHFDDKAAVSALYDSWMPIAGGKGRDIGVGADGSVWTVGDNAATGGNNARKFSSTPGGEFWTATPAFGGANISVGPTGIPWVVEAGGLIKRLTTNSPTTGTWQFVPGCAKDIGIGADGSIWAIGCTPVGGGFNIMKFDGTNWVTSNGGAVRIAVGPSGIPWVVNNGNVLYSRTTSSATTGSWNAVPGTWPEAAAGTDIALSTMASAPTNYAWLIGRGAPSFAQNLHAWIQQPGVGDAPSQAGWTHAAKAPPAGRVAVDPALMVWLIDSQFNVQRSKQ